MSSTARPNVINGPKADHRDHRNRKSTSWHETNDVQKMLPGSAPGGCVSVASCRDGDDRSTTACPSPASRYAMPQSNSYEQSARNLLIFKGRPNNPCGLRAVSPSPHRSEETPGASETWPSPRSVADQRSPQPSAPTRATTRAPARQDEKKPRPRVVGAGVVVEPAGIEPASASLLQTVLHA
jgi:hypothetical protein